MISPQQKVNRMQDELCAALNLLFQKEEEARWQGVKSRPPQAGEKNVYEKSNS